MAIEKTTYLYEVLVRGTVDGRLAGAHVVRCERVVDTDTAEVLVERLLAPEAVEVEAVGALLGEEFTTLAAQISALQAEKAVLEAQIAGRGSSAGGGA